MRLREFVTIAAGALLLAAPALAAGGGFVPSGPDKTAPSAAPPPGAAPVTPAPPAGRSKDTGAGQAPGGGNAAPGAAKVTPDELRGVWNGVGRQSGDTWTMKVSFGSGDPQIEYPSLNCGGYWEAINANGGQYRFVEHLTHGQQDCVDNGYVTIRTFPGGLIYEWTRTEGGAVEARGLLKK